MPIGLAHDSSNRGDVGRRHVFMKQIAHRVNKDLPRSAPSQGLTKFVRHEAEIEALLEGMAGYAAKPLCEGLRVTMLAAWADFGTATDGVPRGVCPLDVRPLAHLRRR